MARVLIVDRAIVPEAKILDYLLSYHHSGGRAKARFLEAFGFRATDWHILRDAILAHAEANEIATLHETQFGIRYEIDGALPSPDGRNPIVRVVWFVGLRDRIPRLVTLIPRIIA